MAFFYGEKQAFLFCIGNTNSLKIKGFSHNSAINMS